MEHFVERYGLDNVGFFTVTFPVEVKDPSEAQRRFNNFARRVLSELFGDRIRVLESHSDGRPHYHLLVDCRGDIRTGFNWDYYHRVRLRRSVGDFEKPAGNLGRTLHLAKLHTALKDAGKRYGVGRMELTPIRATSEAVGRYVGGYIAKGSLWRDERYKGARTVSYSRSFTRKVKGAFAWVEHGRKWREAVASWAHSHGCGDLESVKAVFGPKWVYYHGEEILKHGENPVILPDWAKPESALQKPAIVGANLAAEKGRREAIPGSTPQNHPPAEGSGGGGPRASWAGAKRLYTLDLAKVFSRVAHADAGQPHQRLLLLRQ